MTIVICPISTPILKPIRAHAKLMFGRPKLSKTLANPSPCNKPKKNITIDLYFVNDELKKFSIAM